MKRFIILVALLALTACARGSRDVPRTYCMGEANYGTAITVRPLSSVSKGEYESIEIMTSDGIHTDKIRVYCVGV